MWVLPNSINGCFHTLQVYTGKVEGGEKNLGHRIVRDLTASLKGKHHHVYIDNFFTSSALMEDLHHDGIYACGTARKDRRGFSEAIKIAKLKER